MARADQVRRGTGVLRLYVSTSALKFDVLQLKDRCVERCPSKGVFSLESAFGCNGGTAPGWSFMERREVLRLLGSTAALSALPMEAMALIQRASDKVAQTTGLRTLNPHQNATVITISEAIIPATDTPGAKGAKVNEFIDLLLTEWFEPSETKEFLAGIADVDARSRKKFSAAFVDCTPAQQTALLTELDAAAMVFAAGQKQTMQSQATPPPMNFFYQIKKLTLAGYYTSEIGFSQELGKSIIPAEHTGCAPVAAVAR
jgi:hypothetical protein